jgi:hypothetical protein
MVSIDAIFFFKYLVESMVVGPTDSTYKIACSSPLQFSSSFYTLSDTVNIQKEKPYNLSNPTFLFYR